MISTSNYRDVTWQQQGLSLILFSVINTPSLCLQQRVREAATLWRLEADFLHIFLNAFFSAGIRVVQSFDFNLLQQQPHRR
ncbi:hypothetical protein O9929_06530 [Vibrio lentus]|nr:hypothetical protein [Vibrio lentus]